MNLTVQPNFGAALMAGPGFHVVRPAGKQPTQLVLHCPVCGVGPIVLRLQGAPQDPGQTQFTALIDEGLLTVIPSIVLKCCGAHFYLAHNDLHWG